MEVRFNNKANDYSNNIFFRYLAADCNYGGRVFDYFDRRLLKNSLKRRFNVELARFRKYPLSESGTYKVITENDLD